MNGSLTDIYARYDRPKPAPEEALSVSLEGTSSCAGYPRSPPRVLSLRLSLSLPPPAGSPPPGTRAPTRATSRSAWPTTWVVVATTPSTTPPRAVSTRPRPTSVSRPRSSPRRTVRPRPTASSASPPRRGRLQPGHRCRLRLQGRDRQGRGQVPEDHLRPGRLGLRGEERRLDRLHRGAGLLPRRCRRGPEVQGRQDRLHRRCRHPADQEVRRRFPAGCQGDQAERHGPDPVPVHRYGHVRLRCA